MSLIVRAGPVMPDENDHNTANMWRCRASSLDRAGPVAPTTTTTAANTEMLGITIGTAPARAVAVAAAADSDDDDDADHPLTPTFKLRCKLEYKVLMARRRARRAPAPSATAGKPPLPIHGGGRPKRKHGAGNTDCVTTAVALVEGTSTEMKADFCPFAFRAHKVHDNSGSGRTNLYVFSSAEYGVRHLAIASKQYAMQMPITFSATPFEAPTNVIPYDPSTNEYPISYTSSELDPRAIFALDFVGTPTTTSATARIRSLYVPSPAPSPLPTLRLWATGTGNTILTVVPEPNPIDDDGFGEFTFMRDALGAESVIPLVAGTGVAQAVSYFIRAHNSTNYAQINPSNAMRFGPVGATTLLTDAYEFKFTLASATTVSTRLYNIQCMRTGFGKFISFVKSGTVTAMVMVTAPDANSQFSLEMDPDVLGNYRIYHPITDRFLVATLAGVFQPGTVGGAFISSFSLYSRRIRSSAPAETV